MITGKQTAIKDLRRVGRERHQVRDWKESRLKIISLDHTTLTMSH